MATVNKSWVNLHPAGVNPSFQAVDADDYAYPFDEDGYFVANGRDAGGVAIASFLSSGGAGANGLSLSYSANQLILAGGAIVFGNFNSQLGYPIGGEYKLLFSYTSVAGHVFTGVR